MPKTTDADWADRLDAAKKGEISGTETTDIDGETNNEGGQKVYHHLKARKIYIQGSSKNKRIVPEAEAKEILRKRNEAKST